MTWSGPGLPPGAGTAAPPTGRPRFPAGKQDVPELPTEFTPRFRLRQRLEQAAPGQVVVVSAPAGFGKTLMLADWVRNGAGPEGAWITLDADDNDPRRLWSAVVTSLLSLSSGPGDDRLEPVAAEAARGGGADLVEELADALDGLDRPVRLVLDDVHELTGRDVLRDLGRLVRRRPAGLRLVLASRSDPPISIPRLRLEGRLHELRADALRFTLEESAALLQASGPDLTSPQVAVLHARTEGWAAGLRLAAFALRRVEDPAAFLTDFSGDERSVAEYLTGEILDGLGADTQDFLKAVSVCSPVPAALAAQLSGRADADRMLDELRQQTALVERTSPGTYRFHPMLRSYLVADLARQRPKSFRELQGVAARWWYDEGKPVHALRHAERAGDDGLIAALVHHSGVSLLLGGDLGPLRRALAAVGSGTRGRDPMLALTAAITQLEERNLPAAVAELQKARHAWPAAPSAELDALRSSAELLATTQGLPGESFAHPPDDAEPAEPETEALLHASRAIAEFGNPEGADLDLARTEMEQALRLARAHDLGYLEVQSLWMLATVATIRGDLPLVVKTAEQAVTAAARQGRHPSDWSAGPMGLLAYSDLLRGDPTAAVTRCEEAFGTAEPLPPEAAQFLHAVHGAAVADRGDRAAGLAEMRAARGEFGGVAVPPAMLAAVAVLEHRVALLAGNLAAAADVARWLAGRTPAPGEALLMQAWTAGALGRHDRARLLAAPLHDPDTAVLLPHTRVEARLLDAEAALQSGDRVAGRAALEAALATGETLGVVRPFALAGPRTQEALSAREAANGRAGFALRVAAARAAVRPDPAVLLSERELAVLVLLPSLLNAREIAAEFTVSVNTVKSHIRSIYAKLEVSSRREAVVRARDAGLLH